MMRVLYFPMSLPATALAAVLVPHSVILSQPESANNTGLTLQPLPDPFPIAHTPFSLDFHDGVPLITPTDFYDCVNRAHSGIEVYMTRMGDCPIPASLFPRIFMYRCATLFFELLIEDSPSPPTRHIRWSDTLKILQVLGWKMGREGFRQRIAWIIVTQTGEDLGALILTRIGPAEVVTA